MIELMHDAYTEDRIHVDVISMKYWMINAYWCELVHVGMLEHVYGMSID